MRRDAVGIAALGDLHYTVHSQGHLRPTFQSVNERADILLLCGDLTHYGLPEEAEVLAHDLELVEIPMVAVLGNHDFESGRHREVVRVLEQVGVQVLQGSSCVIDGIGFAGTKGFGGGFAPYMLEAWGESHIKEFVEESCREAEQLERALSGLHTEQKVVLLHYAPIRDTVVGEPLEIYSFLGSSRLEEPLDRHKPRVVFHGHCHKGSPVGRTKGDVPVYNVAVPILKRTLPEGPRVRVVTIERPTVKAD